jgi:hypothetical protein
VRARTPGQFLREQIDETAERIAFDTALLAELRRLQRQRFPTIVAAKRAMGEAVVRASSR